MQALCVFGQSCEALARSRGEWFGIKECFQYKLVACVKVQLIRWCGWPFLVLLLLCSQAQAETDMSLDASEMKDMKMDVESESGWHVGGEMNAFYTDDVALFSASQRLSLQEDPTQPVIQTTGQGSSGVFEPVAHLTRSLQSSWGRTDLTARAQGFVFTDQAAFSHGTYGAQLTQALPGGETIFRMRYHYGPHLFLGNHGPGELRSSDRGGEYVTTHFGTAELERKLLENVTIRGLARYGDRSYNESFAHRNTRFWTLGTHIMWEIKPGIGLVVGYHYERGLADGRHNPQIGEDISYVTHYVEAELEARFTDKLTLLGGFDLEQTNYTSGLPGDDFLGAREKIYQGEVLARYQLTEALALSIGYLHGRWKLSYEEEAARINTVTFGSLLRF